MSGPGGTGDLQLRSPEPATCPSRDHHPLMTATLHPHMCDGTCGLPVLLNGGRDVPCVVRGCEVSALCDSTPTYVMGRAASVLLYGGESCTMCCAGGGGMMCHRCAQGWTGTQNHPWTSSRPFYFDFCKPSVKGQRSEPRWPNSAIQRPTNQILYLELGLGEGVT